MKNTFIILLFCSFILSCSNKEKELELTARIVELEKNLDECQNGAEKLMEKMKLSFQDKDFNQVKSIFLNMKEKHPESPLFIEANKIHSDALKIEEDLRLKEEKRIAEEEKKKLASLNKLKKSFDDVSGYTWYKNPYFTHYNNSNLTSIFIGEKETSKWVFLKMSYQGDDWIFFEQAFLSYDGNTKEIVFDNYEDKKTDNDGGVWEWILVVLNESDFLFLREFASSDNAKMRLSGKYSNTRNLSQNEKKGILDVLNGYEVLKNQK